LFALSRRLVLFDIDGTLIATNRAGRQVLSHGLHDVFGTHGALDETSFAGKTDLGIIVSALAAAGLAEAEIRPSLPRLYRAMARHGASIFPGDELAPCPGILPLLAELRADPRVILGLQTGNIEATALLKLRAAGLDPAWFPVGAFGSDSVTRAGLFPVAWRRAGRLAAESFSGHNTIAVGDTPGDIQAAQVNGVTCLAVASGFSHFAELAECRPDHLLSDLADTRAVLTILTGNHKH
jgi:phosphoglycolate phosphatase